LKRVIKVTVSSQCFHFLLLPEVKIVGEIHGLKSCEQELTAEGTAIQDGKGVKIIGERRRGA